MTYNADGSDFYILAQSMSERFEERFQKIFDEFGEDVICGNVGENINTGSGSGRPMGKKSRNNSFSSRATTPTSSLEKLGSGSVTASKMKRAAKGEDKSAKDIIVPLDTRTRFVARLQRLSGMELGHVLKVSIRLSYSLFSLELFTSLIIDHNCR